MATRPPYPSHHNSQTTRSTATLQASTQQTETTSHNTLARAPAPAPNMCKVVITIPSLVCLRRTLRRWRSCAAAAAAAASSSSDAAVPAGHVAVSVQGTSSSSAAAAPRRFVVRVAHLSHPAFLELLRQAEEEYGFPAAPRPVTLPCDEDHFLDVLHRVSSSAAASSCVCGPVAAARRRRGGDARPLLQGMAVEKLVW